MATCHPPMQLISYLQEAADIPLADLKAAVKKDKRVNKIFTKNLQLDEIPDIKEFINTLRFYVLNNRHVIDFVKKRGPGSQYLSSWILKAARELRPETLDQKGLDELREAITDIFRDVTTTTNATFSNDTGKWLYGWLNDLAGYRGALAYGAVRELKTLPNIRPSKPVHLYRGLTFDKASLKERDRGDGTMDVGAGLQFLRSVRDGKRVVDIEYGEATKWYRDKKVAISNAMSDRDVAHEPNMDRSKLKGELGFVISILAQPSDIIVDTALLPKPAADPTVVLQAGEYVVRISNKYTPAGEVDPIDAHDDSSEAGSILESLQLFAHVFKPPFHEPASDDITRGGTGPERIKEIKALSAPDMKGKAIKSLQVLLDYYNQHLKNIPPNELNDLAGHKTLSAAAQVAMKINELLNDKISHPTEKDEGYRKGHAKQVPRHELTAEQIWDAKKFSSLNGSLNALNLAASTDLKSPGRYQDWSSWGPIISLMYLGGVPIPSEIHRRPGSQQAKAAKAAVDGFYHVMGEPEPTDMIEAVRKMADMIYLAEQNAAVLLKVWEVRHLLDRLKA